MKKIIIVLAMVLAGVAMYAQEPQVLVLKARGKWRSFLTEARG